jgi:hypothetical protein
MRVVAGYYLYWNQFWLVHPHPRGGTIRLTGETKACKSPANNLTSKLRMICCHLFTLANFSFTSTQESTRIKGLCTYRQPAGPYWSYAALLHLSSSILNWITCTSGSVGGPFTSSTDPFSMTRFNWLQTLPCSRSCTQNLSSCHLIVQTQDEVIIVPCPIHSFKVKIPNQMQASIYPKSLLQVTMVTIK